MLSSRRIRRERLVKDYIKTKTYNGNYPLFIVSLLREITYLILIVISYAYLSLGELLAKRYEGIIPFVFTVYGNPTIGGWIVVSFCLIQLLIAFILSISIFNRISNVTDIDRYEEQTLAKLIKLGGDSEVLDKIDREFGEASKQEGLE
jgi:hypothetical protein